VTEAAGETERAFTGYVEAARRWESFGVVPEKGFALLGEGRCLVADAKASEAAVALKEAREVFVALGAAPALATTDALLAKIG